jgi:hypothetical protein
MKKTSISSSGQADYPLTWDQVAAFRLSRHHLLKRARVRALASVAGDIAGVQAQLISAAQTALWSRIQDLQIAHVEAAMKRRVLVKAACMRQTLFLVPAADLAVFVRGTSRRAEKEIRWALGKGVSEHALEAGIEAALNALDEPRTRAEIAERACRILGVQVQAYHGGGWGSNRKLAAVPVGHLNYPVVDLLHLVATRGVVCYGPYRGNEPTFVRADAYLPGWKDVSREQAEDILLHRYLHAFGPATAEDFSLWTGMTFKEARDIWAREQSGLAPVSVEGWKAEILREDLKDLAQASFEQPVVRLLPYFDTFLFGHRERDHLVTVEQRPSVYRAQGWIAPVVLVNGRVIGVWESTLEKNQLHVQVTKFEPISRMVAAGIREEALNLGRFLGASTTAMRINGTGSVQHA